MKIKSIEYYNFRNFAEQGIIEFATDGSMTVIYGTNGDGKTTLHQLFQWILYGKVNFTKLLLLINYTIWKRGKSYLRSVLLRSGGRSYLSIMRRTIW